VNERQLGEPVPVTPLDPVTEYKIRTLELEIRVLELEQKLSRKLKLYVWRDVYTDYTPGVAFALAENAEQARQMIVDQVNYVDPGLAKAPEEYDEPFAYHLYGGG
jgi:hypothetical protein